MISIDRQQRPRSRSSPIARRSRLAMGLALIALAFLPVFGDDQSSPAPQAVEAAPTAPMAKLVVVPLPLRGAEVERVLDQVASAISRLPKQGKVRPLLILEFAATAETAGEGTEFSDAFKLARGLTSEEVSGVRTVAFLPHSVKGHAVLPVIACDEIVMANDAEFGAAGIDENQIDRVMRAGYEDIADSRRTIPKSLALALLDRELSLWKVQTLEGTRIVLESELAELERATTVSSKKPLKPTGDHASFTGATWRHELGYVSHLASTHQELAEALKISETQLEENPLAGQKPNAVRIEFNRPVNARVVTRARKLLNDQLKNSEVNLIILHIRSEGGSLDDAVSFAHELTFGVDRTRVRTVAYIEKEARGSAAMIALACDELVMEEGGELGGEGNASLGEADFKRVEGQVQAIMAAHDRSWSPALALVGHPDPIRRWSHSRTGEKRLMSDDEHSDRKDREDWSVEQDHVELVQGISTEKALELGLAQHQARTFDEVKTLYRIDTPIKTASVNWALAFIESLHDPRLSGLLLFIGTFALFSELSQPGLGVPGFIAGVCFLLFFWANFLHGTADMLELLLFVAGAVCICLELFVAPGTMVFGVGGAFMIVISIVLASQTFILPTNAYQLQQLPSSLLMAVGAAAGGVVGIVVLQRFLPHTPYFKRLILQPPIEEEAAQLQQRERLSSFDYLLGKRGIALTPLVPAGKAQFGDDVVDVISTGTLVEVGSTVTVVEAIGSRVKVRPVE